MPNQPATPARTIRCGPAWDAAQAALAADPDQPRRRAQVRIGVTLHDGETLSDAIRRFVEKIAQEAAK